MVMPCERAARGAAARGRRERRRWPCRRRSRAAARPRAGRTRVEELLGPPGRDVVGQGAPEPPRRDMVGLLHYALAVAAPRRARPRGHPVVLGYRRERRGHPPRFWVHDGGHSVEPPRRGEPAQGAGHAVQARNQPRLVHRRRQPAAPPPRMGQRAGQQARLAAPPQRMGGSGSSAQSHWVSSPGGCSITATGRPFAGWHGSQCGRRPLPAATG